MKQVALHSKTGEIKVLDVPHPFNNPGGPIVKNAFSLISAGTERSVVRFAKTSLISKAFERPDLVKKVLGNIKKAGLSQTYRSASERLDAWVPLGYSCAGIVSDTGSPGEEEFSKGQAVACAGAGHANHAEYVSVPRNLCVKIPPKVSLELGTFATVGSIALQGVRQAAPNLGETIAVVGIGLVGLLTVQILKANGCKVLGVDLDPSKVKLAKALGADAAGDSEAMIRACRKLTNGYGADAVIITASTSGNEPIELAAELSRAKGRVVAVGAVGMNIPREAYYKKELELRLSMSYGPGRYDPIYEEYGIDYPYAYVRWTEKRNMEAFLELVSQQKVTPDKLITHRIPIGEAHRAYEMLEGKEPCIAILLTYPENPENENEDLQPRQKIEIPPKKRATTTSPLAPKTIGVIGVGNFAKTIMLPALRKLGATFQGIASASGLTARTVGEKYQFAYASSDIEELFRDPSIGSVFIFTPHHLHAPLVVKGLETGKRVFTEKPLAINEQQLSELTEALKQITQKGHSNPCLMVGFNRRFSPLAVHLKTFFVQKNMPLIMNYRVNAGEVPHDSWIHDPSIGGGRIVGEVCHFIDFLSFVTDAAPVSVDTHTIKTSRRDLHPEENVILTLKFDDGSLGEITYLSGGDPTGSKERIEIFGDGKTAILDDFRTLTLSNNGKNQVLKMTQNKGHLEELIAFFQMAQGEAPLPYDFQHLHAVTMMTFLARNQIG